MLEFNRCRNGQQVKPFTHALPLRGNRYQSSSKWLFCFWASDSGHALVKQQVGDGAPTPNWMPDLYASRTPHVSKHPSRGGAEGKRTRYAIWLGGSSRITRATGRITKSRGAALAGIVMPVRAVRTFPSYSFNGVGGSLGENPICRY
jgi:hypothetical protein